MTRRHLAEAGFTFVELMIVIFIIGLASTAVILAIPDQDGSLAVEADRFAARAKSLRDKAIVDSRPSALQLSRDGYILSARRGGEWNEIGREKWAPSTRVTHSPGQSGRIRFDSTGMATPLKVQLERDDRSIAIEIEHDGSIRVHR